VPHRRHWDAFFALVERGDTYDKRGSPIILSRPALIHGRDAMRATALARPALAKASQSRLFHYLIRFLR
jgi:hypothetical protein